VLVSGNIVKAIKILLYKTILNPNIILPIIAPVLAIKCSSCPLSTSCPIILIYTSGVSSTLIILYRRLLGKLRTRIVLVVLLAIATLTLSLVATHASLGADRLIVEPSTIILAYGGEVEVTIRVRFAHKQPCPFPTWSITYNVSGVDVIWESDVQIVSGGWEALKRLKLKPYKNTTLTVVYSYGRGCPFGRVEVVKVPIIVYERAPVTPSTPIEHEVDVDESVNTLRLFSRLLEYICSLRHIILCILLAVTLIIVYVMVKRVKYGSRINQLTLLRHTIMLLVLLLYIAPPLILYGYICPCSIILPQYIILPNMMSTEYLMVIAVILLSSIVTARLWCGWLCPLGVCQEYLSMVYGRAKLPVRVNRFLSKLKYIVLAVVVLLVLASGSPLWCSNCPTLTLTETLHSLVVPVEKLILLVIALTMIILCILVPRFFCRYICPVGALLELLVRLRVYIFKVKSGSKCRHCRYCHAVSYCPMGLSRPGGVNCISCLNCISRCPFNSLELSLTFRPVLGRHTLKW